MIVGFPWYAVAIPVVFGVSFFAFAMCRRAQMRRNAQQQGGAATAVPLTGGFAHMGSPTNHGYPPQPGQYNDMNNVPQAYIYQQQQQQPYPAAYPPQGGSPYGQPPQQYQQPNFGYPPQPGYMQPQSPQQPNIYGPPQTNNIYNQPNLYQ